MSLHKEYRTHPSYGLVQFNRIQGGETRLFGSSVGNPTRIALVIKKCEVANDFGRSWYHGREELVEVELSPSQFSELLTTMNMGSGVPCTINHVKGERYELPKDEEEGEVDKARSYFKGRMEQLKSKTYEDVDMIGEILDSKKAIGKNDRKKIKDSLSSIVQELESNMPFYFDCFAESTDKVVAQAKGEIDGFVTNMVQKTGLEALKKLFKPDMIKLGDGKLGGKPPIKD